MDTLSILVSFFTTLEEVLWLQCHGVAYKKTESQKSIDLGMTVGAEGAG